MPENEVSQQTWFVPGSVVVEKREDVLQWCIKREARPGKAYCERCTDYAARYVRRRAYRESMSMAHRGDGFDPFRDKIARIGG
jgi:hypothetical protein